MSQAGALSSTGGGGSGTDIRTITGNSGGAVPPNALHNINVLGSGSITVAGNIGTNTLTINSAGGGFIWNDVTGTSATMSGSNGYMSNNAGLVTLTLPAIAGQFDTIAIQGFGAGGWKIAQNANQTIVFGDLQTSIGIGGSLSSTNQYDAVTILCAGNFGFDTYFLIQTSIGNLSFT